MLRIGDTVVSLDLIKERFRCDLSVCKGNCCRYGDAGAPLTAGEAKILKSIYPDIRPFLRDEGISAIEHSGTSTQDKDGEWVTPLIGNEECAYTSIVDDIYMCAIERAYNEGAVTFRKPLSCHLFPVRIKEFTDFTGVSYEEWSICQGGRIAGKVEDLRVYRFLKEPLIRAFGKEWYRELEIIHRELPRSGIAEI
jgi:hypothetical protein